MTDQNDLHNRSPAPDKTAYGWIIGGVAAVAVIFGIFTMYRHNNNYTAPTADRGVVTTPATAPTDPATTGSAIQTAPTSR
jgi:hypothetical protein